MAAADKGPGTRLGKEAVLRLLERMQDDLSRHQLERLGKLAALIDGNGRIGLDRALEVATPGGDDQRRQAAFRQFRRTVAEAAEAAQVTLALVQDSLKLAPAHRFCWFEGEDGPGTGRAGGDVAVQVPAVGPGGHHGGSVGFRGAAPRAGPRSCLRGRCVRRPVAGWQGRRVHPAAPA